MKTISVTAAQTQLAELIEALKEGPVLLLRKGQPCAALVGLGERFDREAFSLGRNKRLRRLMDGACRRTGETGGIAFSDIVAEVERQARGKTRVSRPRASRR
jgi:antitoxin (DNA-binding transcriptional repressor) of toxin-antitoxin stability system